MFPCRNLSADLLLSHKNWSEEKKNALSLAFAHQYMSSDEEDQIDGCLVARPPIVAVTKFWGLKRKPDQHYMASTKTKRIVSKRRRGNEVQKDPPPVSLEPPVDNGIINLLISV